MDEERAEWASLGRFSLVLGVPTGINCSVNASLTAAGACVFAATLESALRCDCAGAVALAEGSRRSIGVSDTGLADRAGKLAVYARHGVIPASASSEVRLVASEWSWPSPNTAAAFGMYPRRPMVRRAFASRSFSRIDRPIPCESRTSPGLHDAIGEHIRKYRVLLLLVKDVIELRRGEAVVGQALEQLHLPGYFWFTLESRD